MNRRRFRSIEEASKYIEDIAKRGDVASVMFVGSEYIVDFSVYGAPTAELDSYHQEILRLQEEFEKERQRASKRTKELINLMNQQEEKNEII